MKEFNNVRALQVELWQNCSNNCSFCLCKGTQILLPDFSEKSIQDIISGEEILTYDPSSHTYVKATVSGVSHRHISERVYNISIGENRLVITKGHKIATKPEYTGWVLPEELYSMRKKVPLCAPGVDKTNLQNDYSTPKRVWMSDFEGDVYNLETSTGTYMANGVLVHNCYLNKEKVNQTPYEQEKSIQKTINIIDNLDSKFNAFGLIGGEFFGGQLSTATLRNSFRELVLKLDKMLDHRLEQVWVSASLLTPDLSDFLYCFNGIKNKNKFLICTSYDTDGRFRSSEQRDIWFNNIKKLNSLWFIVHTQIIATDSFINESLSTSILEDISKYSMVDFKSPTISREDYYKRCILGKENYRDVFKSVCDSYPKGFFIGNRNNFLKFLFKIYKIFGSNKLLAYGSNKVRSDELHILSSNRVVTDRWSIGGEENAPCGHPWDSYCYLNSDKCSRCDAINILENICE